MSQELHIFIYFILTSYVTIISCYEVPPAEIELLSPRGFRVSIPDEAGITLFAFHGNINEDFENGLEAGQIAVDVLRKKNGRWYYTNRDKQLKNGDILYYWLYVIKDGLGYQRLFQSYPVTDSSATVQPTLSPPTPKPTERPFVPTKPPPSPTQKPDICFYSITEVKGEKQCSNRVIFQADFRNGMDKRFKHVYQIGDVSNDFTIFQAFNENSYIEDGCLTIKPTLSKTKYDVQREEINFLRDGCVTLEPSSCIRRGFPKFILPPILSARLTTKEEFSFIYGIVEIKAKLPEGDWVVPELWLLPKSAIFGVENTGHMAIGCSFGNKYLTSNNQEIGNTRLFSGLYHVENNFTSVLMNKGRNLWSDQFHVFKVEWRPDQISFYVDNEMHGTWTKNVNQPFLGGSNSIAPFNKEFYISLGLHVGGNFPADAKTGQGGSHDKPWFHDHAAVIKEFYDDEVNWIKTWSDKTKLKVEYVKVTAL